MNHSVSYCVLCLFMLCTKHCCLSVLLEEELFDTYMIVCLHTHTHYLLIVAINALTCRISSTTLHVGLGGSPALPPLLLFMDVCILSFEPSTHR